MRISSACATLSGHTALLSVGLDADFHEGLATLSGNPFAIAAVKQQVAMRRLLEFGFPEQAPRIAAWCREHLAVIDALLAGDRPGAADRLAEHLRLALSRTLPEPAAPAAPAAPLPRRDNGTFR